MKGQTVTAAFEPCQAWSGYDSTWWKSQTRQIHWLVKKLPRLGAGWNPIPIHLKSPSDHDRRLPRNQRCHPLGYTFCDQPVPTWTISPRGHASHLEPWQVMMLKVQGQFRARPHGQVSEKKCTSWKEGNDAIKFQRISFFRFWTSFYYELCTFIGMEFPIYIYIYPSYILHVQQKSCDDVSPVRTPGSTTALLSLVDRSVDGNGQLFDIFVTWDTFSVVLFSPSDDFPLVYIFFLQDSSFDAAWPGGSGFGEFYARLFGWPFTPNEAQGTHLTGGFGSHQHGSRAATLPGLRGWDRPEDGTWGENGDRELKGKMRPKNGGSLNLDSWIVSPYGVWICFMESESWIWPQVSAFSWHLNASLEPLRLEINFPYYALMSSEFFRGLAHFYA